MKVFLLLILVSFSSAAFEGVENDECRTSEFMGTCVNTKKCKVFKKDTTRSQICSFSGKDPIICCPNNQINQTQRKSSKKCDEYRYVAATRSLKRNDDDVIFFVVGGSTTVQNEFPFMSAIGVKQNNEIEWKCGGSLVSDQHIITAAHCVNGYQNDDNLIRQLVVRVGAKNLKNEDTNVKYQQFEVTTIWIHPAYNENLNYNDIAIMKLATRAAFNEHVRPACLHQYPEVDVFKAEVLGWGTTSYAGENSDELLKATLSIFPNKNCSQFYAEDVDELPDGIIQSQICAGDPLKKKDTCQSDSGGPIFVKRTANSTSFYELIGVTSFGKFCAAGTPGVYSRISSFLEWLESIVWPDRFFG